MAQLFIIIMIIIIILLTLRQHSIMVAAFPVLH